MMVIHNITIESRPSIVKNIFLKSYRINHQGGQIFIYYKCCGNFYIDYDLSGCNNFCVYANLIKESVWCN